MKVSDIDWNIVPLFNFDDIVVGYHLTGSFHDVRRSHTIPVGGSEALDQSMRRLAYELEIMHSRERGHL